MTRDTSSTSQHPDEEDVNKVLLEGLQQFENGARAMGRRWFSLERLLFRCCLYLAFACAGLAFVAGSVPPQAWTPLGQLIALSLATSVVTAYLGYREIERSVSGPLRLGDPKAQASLALPALAALSIAIAFSVLDPTRALVSNPIVLAVPVSFVVAVLTMIVWLLVYEREHGPVFVNSNRPLS